MKSKLLRICITAGSLGFIVAVWTTEATAQAPAGPLPAAQPQPPSSPDARPQEQSAPVKPRTSILGAWKLNRDESDDPRKKMQEARGGNGGGGGRGGVRMGIPGMGGGPYGGRRGGGGSESDEDRQRMQEFMNPSRSLTVAEAKKDVEIDMFDDQERKSAFFTDGRKLQKTKDSTTQEIAAHWDSNRLVTDEKNPSGRKISRTYELSYDGMQLYETLRLTRGRSDSQTSIRYVYDQADARTAHSSQTRR
jgi:YD repeat-containing protein